MLDLQLNYSGGGFLLGNTSESTTELCPPHKRAPLTRQSTISNIAFHRRTLNRDGTELSEYF